MEDKQIDFGFIKSNILYRNVEENDNGLELVAIKEGEEGSAIQYYIDAYNKFFESFEKLIEQVNATENKGSFLVKLQNTKIESATHKGLGDYQIIANQVILQENLILDVITSNRARNTDIKKALMLELDAALVNNDFYEVGNAIKDIKQRWVKTGRVSDGVYETLEAEFKTKTQGFYDKRQSFFEDKNKLKAAKVKKYEVILEKIKAIVESGKLKSNVDTLKALQTEWKDLGSIPEKDYKPLNKVYWDICQKFFDAVRKERKTDNSLSNDEMSKNLILKKEIIEQLKSIDEKALFENTTKGFNVVKSAWKNIGKVIKQEASTLNDEYYNLNGSILEKQFIFSLAGKKFNSFQSDDKEKKSFLLKKLTRNLLDRDKSELTTFQENMDNMHVNKGSFIDMLESKLNQHKRKVELKIAILKSL